MSGSKDKKSGRARLSPEIALKIEEILARPGMNKTKFIAKTGLSDRNMYRIFNDVENREEIRVSGNTQKQLLRVVGEFLGRPQESPQLKLNAYQYLWSRMNAPDEDQENFMAEMQGSHKCFRLSRDHSKILVTYMEIYYSDYVPAFRHIERIPDWLSPEDGDEDRLLEHEGFVLYREPRVYLLGVSGGNIRHIIGTKEEDGKRRIFGILLTVDSQHAVPFATRVYIERADRHLSFNEDKEQFGKFDVDDMKLKRIQTILKGPSLRDGFLVAPSD